MLDPASMKTATIWLPLTTSEHLWPCQREPRAAAGWWQQRTEENFPKPGPSLSCPEAGCDHKWATGFLVQVLETFMHKISQILGNLAKTCFRNSVGKLQSISLKPITMWASPPETMQCSSPDSNILILCRRGNWCKWSQQWGAYWWKAGMEPAGR